VVAVVKQFRREVTLVRSAKLIPRAIYMVFLAISIHFEMTNQSARDFAQGACAIFQQAPSLI
jgi:hypothetical protein